MLSEKTIINTIKKHNEISAEQSVDTEFTLPDYYPEISKILKCITDVNILSKQIKGNNAEIGGQVAITLLYADKENGINSFSHICPFIKNVDVGNSFEDCFVSCVLRGEFLNSKATAPRKVEIHGSITLGITVETNNSIQCISNAFEEGVFKKCIEKEYCEVMLPVSKSLFLEDEISVGSNHQSISKILRYNAESTINECKIVTNKIVVKGELKVSVLYCPVESNKPVLLEHIHGFSQIFDKDKLDEFCTCSAQSTVCSFEIRPKTSLDGEVKSILFEAKVNIELFAEKKTNISLVSDAFTNVNKSEIEFSNLELLSNREKINENYLCKKTLDFTDGLISEIYDLWCKTAVNFVSFEAGELLIKGVVMIYILGDDINGLPVFFERSVDYEYRYSPENHYDDCKCRYNVSVAAINFNKNADSGIDIEVELSLKADLYCVEGIKAVTKLNIDQNLSLEKDNDTAITLYFANSETVWDIAKKYLADPQKICMANSLENCDTKCNNILLIPNT